MGTQEQKLDSSPEQSARPPENPSIPAAWRDRIEPYVALAKSVAEDQLRSITLYGMTGGPTGATEREPVRNVMVLTQMDLAILQKLASHGAKLGKALIRAPLIMTPEYIQSSLDTFPLELLEIQQTRITVYGEDAFSALKLEEPHVRLQCERELKSLLIGLRQGLLAAAGRGKVLDAVVHGAADGLQRTLRGLLFLDGKREAQAPPAMLKEVERIADRKLDGIRSVFSKGTTPGFDGFQRFYADVAALGKVADGWS